MLTWLRSLSRVERATLLACFLGWALDAMDSQAANMLIPTLSSVFGVSKAQIGVMATATLIGSGIGGWLAGSASDRFGRVVILQVTILWFSVGSVLCSIAGTFPQLVAARVFQGIGFGGEWAVGAVLIAEMVAPARRATAVGVVQSGYSLGVAAAAGLYYTAFSLLPEGLAWRAVFLAGVLPALLIIYIRRELREPAGTVARRGAVRQSGTGLLAIFGPTFLRATLLGMLLCTTLQGASFAMLIWLPTMLKVDFGFSVGLVSIFFVLQSVGAFAGYLVAAVTSDRLGRRASLWLFILGSIATTIVLCYVHPTATPMLILALPFGFFSLGVYSNFGPVLSELYPAAVRGSGQGFCYNVGRAVGSLFPAAVGLLSATKALPLAVGAVSIGAYLLACVTVALLPETRGKILDGSADTSTDDGAATGEMAARRG